MAGVLFSGCTRSLRNITPVSMANDSLIIHYNTETEDFLSVGLWGIPIPCDYDGDGLKDLLVSCPDTPYKGLYFFRNIGTSSNPFFDKAVRVSEIGKNNIRYSETSEGIHIVASGVEYINFLDSLYDSSRKIEYSGEVLGRDFKKSRSNMWSYVDWDNDSDNDIIVGIDTWDDYGWDDAYDDQGCWTNGPLHGYVYLLENVNGKYWNKGKVKAGGEIIDVYGAPNPCVADFDGDGDLDIICGEFVDGLTWFENIGTRELPEFKEGKQLCNADGEIRFHVEMIVPVVSDFDGDGAPDLIVGDEDGRIAWLRNTGHVRDCGMPEFENIKYFMQKADVLKFGALSTPFATDWDGDGKVDILSGNSAGELCLIRNISENGEIKWATPELFKVNGKNFRIIAGENGSIQGPAERKWGYTVLSSADWDGDGRSDIIVNSIFGEIMWLKNLGSEDMLSLSEPQHIYVRWNGKTPKPEWNWWNPEKGTLVTQWRTTPVATDWNKDSVLDLILMDHEGYLALYEGIECSSDGTLLKSGKRIFYCTNCSVYDQKKGVVNPEEGLLRLNAGEAGKSGRRKICFMDWDGDGLEDLLVDSRSAAWFRNLGEKGGKTILEFMGDVSDAKLAGHSTCPTAGDIDSDGLDELIIGAEDGHFYLMKNKI